MRSFISSFKFPAAALAVSAVVFGLYNLLVVTMPLSQLPRTPNQKDNWRSKYQELSTRGAPDILLVGSSFTNAIPSVYSPKNGYNFGLSGSSTNTALELIRRSGSLPKVMIIEVNALSRGIDTPFLQSTETFAQNLGKTFPALQIHNQPIPFFSEHISGETATRKKNQIKNACGTPREADAWVTARQRVKTGWEKPQKLDQMNHNTRELQKQIDYFISQGVEVYLVNFPVHPELVETTYYSSVKKISREVFPEDQYNWFEIDGEGLFWFDGIHVVNAMALLTKMEDALGAATSSVEWDPQVSCKKK